MLQLKSGVPLLHLPGDQRGCGFLYSPVGKKAEPRVTQTWVQILWGRGACGTLLETSCGICKMW